jgi:ADP-Ribosyltransferase in polyvalent proteins
MQKPWLDDAPAANGRPVKENFGDWFEGSKAVGADGAPLVTFHGTFADIERFRSVEPDGEGIFFAVEPSCANFYATGKGANVVPAFLSIKNPLVITWRAWMLGFSDGLNLFHLGKAGLERMGHDGFLLTKPDPKDPAMSLVTWIALRPEQIKSAAGNSGLYLKDSASLDDQAEALALQNRAKTASNAMKAKAVVAKANRKTPQNTLA